MIHGQPVPAEPRRRSTPSLRLRLSRPAGPARPSQSPRSPCPNESPLISLPACRQAVVVMTATARALPSVATAPRHTERGVVPCSPVTRGSAEPAAASVRTSERPRPITSCRLPRVVIGTTLPTARPCASRATLGRREPRTRAEPRARRQPSPRHRLPHGRSTASLHPPHGVVYTMAPFVTRTVCIRLPHASGTRPNRDCPPA